MKAIIMAGGEGTRLRPLTCNLPKPMVPIMGKPAMEHIINLLKRHGITEIGVTLAYLPQAVTSYFGDGAAFGVTLRYFTEPQPLGTAGSVKNAEDFLAGDDFLVISGDSLTDADLTGAIAFHRAKNADATLLLKSVDIPLDYGVVITNDDGKIERFVEKPDWSEAFSDTVNTGIYLFRPEVLSAIPAGQAYDFSKDLFPEMLAGGKALYGLATDRYWCDIGDLEVYKRCHFDILDGKVALCPSAREAAPGVYVEDGANVEEGAILLPPCYISAGAKIKKGAAAGPYAVIGPDSLLCAGASVKKSVLWDRVTIKGKGQIRSAVLCSKVHVKEGASVFEQCVVGEGTQIGAGSVVKPSIKIWPYKEVDSQSTVSANLIWGSRHLARLFGYKGIAGEINVDITPEFASHLGAAFGSFYRRGSLAVASDGSAPARMLAASITAGLQSAGAAVFELGEQPLPVTRSAVRFYGLTGGVHVSISEVGGEKRATVDFLNQYGANLARADERKLESIFSREDFLRAEAEDILDVEELYEYKLYYLREIINRAKSRDMGFKILVQSASSWGQRLAASAAKDLGVTAEIRTGELDLSDTLAVGAFCRDVASGGYDLGAIFDRAAQTLTLVDEGGSVITPDLYKAMCALVVMETYPGAEIAADALAPSVIESLAKKNGAKVRRTRHSALELMGELSQAPSGPMHMQFVLHFDAVGALIFMMDYLKQKNTTLCALAARIPKFYIVRRDVGCPPSEKPKVLKHLVKNAGGREVDATDGVKIKDAHGWVMIIPDEAAPTCHVVAQSQSEEYAQELCLGLEQEILNLENPKQP